MEINNQSIFNITPASTPEAGIDEFKTRALYEGTPLSMAGSAALIIILSISHWNVIGHGSLISWTLIISSVIVLRILAWFLWRQNIYTLSTTAWLIIFRAGSWIAGAAWGSSAFLMFADYNPSYQALLAYTIAGVSSGSFSVLIYDKKAAVGFVSLAIFPLTIRLFLEDGPTAVPMAIMSAIYLVFVVSASSRARRNLEQEHEKNARLIAWNKERIEQQKLNKAISQAKTQFIKDANINNIFLSLLEETLELTDSRFGFIGEVCHLPNQHSELQIQAISNFTNDHQLSLYYQKQDQLKAAFAQASVPFGAAILNGKPIISNDPAKDIRGGGLPVRHPPLSSFLAIPVFIGATQVAVLGLGNRPQGYDEQLFDLIRPVIATLAQFFEAILHSRQQKNYEEKLQNSAKQTQAILDEVFDAIITIDPDGAIKSFNHAAEMIFGYRAHEIINSNITRLIPQAQQRQDSKSDNNDHIYRMLEGQEQTAVRRNGKQFPINLATSEIQIDGEPLTIGVVRDMSETKRNEELKNQFISTLSHELRTPLTSIAGSLGILNSNSPGIDSEKQQKLIAIALQNSLHLQNLINDLLEMDKLIANKMAMDIQPHDIVKLVTQAIQSSERMAEKNQVQFNFNNPPPETLIYGDERKIQRILCNLLSNSVKFSNPESTVDISIVSAGKFARVSITDYGSEVSKAFKVKLFQRFSQVSSGKLYQQDGHGLGLAISKELTQKMGGNIGFTENEGHGSSFYFEVPLVDNNIQY
ncbi:MAG TPA: ATP-binding protein [Cellvibrio sp.]|nr:ATP-binding protein [Cellvibrio sp.]